MMCRVLCRQLLLIAFAAGTFTLVAADSPAPSFVTVGEKQAVVKLAPFTGKNEKVAKRNNTITLTEASSANPSPKGKAKVDKAKKADTLYELTPDVVVRWQKLPELKDASGKIIKRTPEELQRLKGTAGLPGYEAGMKDLSPNQIVTVRLVRMRGSEGAAAEKLFVSRIIIQGESPAPPEDPKKKKK
jgi:hypothetical protein